MTSMSEIMMDGFERLTEDPITYHARKRHTRRLYDPALQVRGATCSEIVAESLKLYDKNLDENSGRRR